MPNCSSENGLWREHIPIRQEAEICTYMDQKFKGILHISKWLIHEDGGDYILNEQPWGSLEFVFRELVS